MARCDEAGSTIRSQPQVAADFCVMGILQCDRSGRRGGAASADHIRSTAKQRREIEMYAINQALVERCTQHATSALNEHARDLPLSQFAQDRAQTFVAINDRSRVVFV